jgi:hypothetical protein
VKITRLRAEGFRSLRSPQKLELKAGRSMCLLADNGRGKSSVVDALEFWSTGDVGWVHRDGVGLGALVHLSANQALVEVATDSVVARRRLSGSRGGDLEVAQGVMLAGSMPGPIPMLRHRTMSKFVDMTANDKRTELLTMLGLTELVPFRLGLRSAARRARADARTAKQTAETVHGALQQTLGDIALPDKITEIAGRADVAISSEEELIAFSTAQAAGAAPAATRMAQVEELIGAVRAARASTVDDWNAAVANRQVAGEQGLSALLAIGQQVLTSWDEDRCPLCLVEQPRNVLADQVRERALELAEADRRFADVAAQAEDREQIVLRLGRALRGVVDDERNATWEYLGAAQDVLETLRSEAQAIKDARASRTALNQQLPDLPDGALASLRADVGRAPGDSGLALLELAQLQARVLADRRAAAELQGSQHIAEAVERAAAIGETAVRSAIDEALSELNASVGGFYAKLIGISPYGDVQLNYQDARAGGVEFSFVWDGREESISPPSAS